MAGSCIEWGDFLGSDQHCCRLRTLPRQTALGLGHSPRKLKAGSRRELTEDLQGARPYPDRQRRAQDLYLSVKRTPIVSGEVVQRTER